MHSFRHIVMIFKTCLHLLSLLVVQKQKRNKKKRKTERKKKKRKVGEKRGKGEKEKKRGGGRDGSTREEKGFLY